MLTESRSPNSGRMLLLLVLSAVVQSGCGGDSGPKRYGVSGTVTFDGQPVPVGTITFDPDVSKGNRGPQGRARIVDGKYDTGAKDGKGMVGGPHVVTISGAHRESAGEDDPVPSLFKEKMLNVDLPTEPSTQDFDIPKSEAYVPPKPRLR